MPQDTPNPTDPQSQQPDPTQPEVTPPAPKEKKRRRWPWVLLALFVIILLLVGLAPMIASTGPVRSLVVSQINQNINGNVQIADWSLSWTGPTTLSGIKVYNDKNVLILDIPRVKLGMSVM